METHAMGDGNLLEYGSCYSPALSTEEVNQGIISLANNDTIMETVGLSKDLLGTKVIPSTTTETIPETRGDPEVLSDTESFDVSEQLDMSIETHS